MFANMFKLSRYGLVLHIVAMVASIHLSRESFAIGMLTALKPFLEHDRKHASFAIVTTVWRPGFREVSFFTRRGGALEIFQVL